jgi:uncharacterized protein DUF4382
MYCIGGFKMKFRLFLTLALFGALASCSDSSTGPDQGRIAVRLTDAPFLLDDVQSIDMFIVRVEARLEAATEADADNDVDDGDASADGWIVLATPNASFDLMDLQNGVNVLLGEATVATGSYQSIRLILDTDKSSVTLKDGMILSGTSTPSILFPSAGNSGIKVLFSAPIDVAEGQTTDVLLDFDAEESFVVRGNTILQNGLLFKPVIKATVNE